MAKIILQVNVNKSDYDLLAKYGFYFEKNIQEYLHDIAEQMRDEIAKQKAEKQANKKHDAKA